MLPRSLRFNRAVGADGLDINFQGSVLMGHNKICWGTGLQSVSMVSDRTSETARDDFADDWFKHF